MEQAQLAELLGVTKSTIWNWENGRSSPPTHRCARVIGFLGYEPFPVPETFSERLVAFRRVRGLTARMAAALAGVDPASWESWERKEHAITPSYRARIEVLLAGTNRIGLMRVPACQQPSG